MRMSKRCMNIFSCRMAMLRQCGCFATFLSLEHVSSVQ
ncbi:hypothetical protein DA2_0116 [Desulfovibrio sp. A2]|nr:hypothetical protein DA2_0116 [Desulfovibrio sp. A2]